jgi:flagellar motor protein MotB
VENIAMRVFARAHWLVAAITVFLSGCMENAYVLKTQVESLQQQNATLAQQTQEVQSRLTSLDEDNQELETALAQARQQVRIAEDEMLAVRDQLSGTADQLAKLRQQQSEAEQHNSALTASLRRRVGASISPNSSLRQNLPAVNIPGVEVRQDGDVVRIEMSGERLFNPGSATLKPEAYALLEQVAREVRATHPDQLIGVEGHTDSAPIQYSGWISNKQLSIARANAVHDRLVRPGGLRPSQLSVTGHGANHPVVSNASEAGRRRNQRVEIVIYPENASDR